MYAQHPGYVVEREDQEESAVGGAVITIVWALTLTFSLFAVLGTVALFLI